MVVAATADPAADREGGGGAEGKKCSLLIKTSGPAGIRALPISFGVKPRAGLLRYRSGLLDSRTRTSLGSPQCPPVRQRLSLASPFRPPLVSARAGCPCPALPLDVEESLSPPQPALDRIQLALPLDRYPLTRTARQDQSDGSASSLMPSSSRAYDYKRSA